MRLIYMNDNPKYRWGYKGCYLDMELAKEVGIIAEQYDNESREEFFDRVSDRPVKNMYGSDEKLDIGVISKDSHCRNYVANQGYGFDKLIYDEDAIVLSNIAYQGYCLDILVKTVIGRFVAL